MKPLPMEHKEIYNLHQIILYLKKKYGIKLEYYCIREYLHDMLKTTDRYNPIGILDIPSPTSDDTPRDYLYNVGILSGYYDIYDDDLNCLDNSVSYPDDLKEMYSFLKAFTKEYDTKNLYLSMFLKDCEIEEVFSLSN